MNASAKMKNLLASVVDLQTKYIDLGEFKKNSCVPIDVAVPPVKISKAENAEELSESKQDQLRICKKKRRRFTHSFYCHDNVH